MAMLTVVNPEGRVQPIKLQPKDLVLGRSADCDIVLDDSFVSRQHARIVHRAGVYAIQDLNSKNGTFVNGAKVGPKPQPLSDGDTVVLGNKRISLRFQIDESTLTMDLSEATDLRVDLASRDAFVGGQRLDPPLTRKEFDLLALLWERRGEACPRDELAKRGWPERPEGDVGDAEIEQYIRRLRRRIGDDAGRLIVTMRRFGYKLV